MQEPPKAIHLSAVRFLHCGREGGEDVGAGHRLGRAGEIGEPLEHGLAARRYAMSGDRRALHGTVL